MHWRCWFSAGANAQLEKCIELFQSHREITDANRQQPKLLSRKKRDLPIVDYMSLQTEEDEIQRLEDIKRIIDAQLGASEAEMVEAFDDGEANGPALSNP